MQLHRFEPIDDMDLDVFAQTFFASKSRGSTRYAFQWAIEGAVVAILSKIGIGDEGKSWKNRIIQMKKPLFLRILPEA